VFERIHLRGQPLDLGITLSCGQSFRWQEAGDGVWRGVVQETLLELVVEGDSLLWRTFPPGREVLVRDYLRLSDDVSAIYGQLSASDDYLAMLIERYRGLRLLRQDPAEALVSFVCSACNGIPRIKAAVEMLAARFGDLVCELGGQCYHAFPRIETLALLDPHELRAKPELGFRSRHVVSVARQVVERGRGWLSALRGLTYERARSELLSLKCVGPKIADCVCLFALDKDEAVPVDTHVRQIAHRMNLCQSRSKTVTDCVYRDIVRSFGERYGRLAGWAQQFLFYDDLRRGRSRLS